MQIEDYYKGCPDFGGCPSIDEFQQVYDPKKFFVVNMSKRADGGSHWVLVFQKLYFDSFGVPPPLTIKPHVDVWNYTEYQDFHSSACGFYCIYVADRLLAGLAPEGDLKDSNQKDEDNEEVLRKYFDGQVGAGIFDKLIGKAKSLIKGRDSESKRLKQFLDTTGNQKIAKVEIARKPVQGYVQTALDLMSGGKYSKKKKELGYDSVFHNYLLVTMADGKTYRVEKNHQIEAAPASQDDFKYERSNVPLNKDLTLKEMMDTASHNDSDFWQYRAKTSNCQHFTKDMLERNGLKPEQDPPIQDAAALIDTLPLGDTIPNALTDTAERLDQIMKGGSVKLGKWY